MGKLVNSKVFFSQFFINLQPSFLGGHAKKYWRGAGVAELARLESVCTPKGYRGFESLSLRKNESFFKEKNKSGKQGMFFVGRGD